MLPLVLPQKDLCLFTGITTLGKGLHRHTADGTQGPSGRRHPGARESLEPAV